MYFKVMRVGKTAGVGIRCFDRKFVLQGSPVRLETANAALLEGAGETWADAFAQEASWKLVGVLSP